jgi:thiol-disulfide isomerase/thioredoxin/regulation of enolase protein 1 (concanavalin A-like superfamily)
MNRTTAIVVLSLASFALTAWSGEAKPGAEKSTNPDPEKTKQTAATPQSPPPASPAQKTDAAPGKTPPAQPPPSGHRCYEPFDYASSGGTLLGKSGGEGFAGPWKAAGFNAGQPEAYRIAAGSLGSSTSASGAGFVETEASRAVALPSMFFGFESSAAYQPIKGIGRQLARPIEASETVTLYVAALFRPGGGPGKQAFGGYIGFYLDGTGNDDLFIGVGGGNQPKYCLENRGGDLQVVSQDTAESGRTDLLVVKAEFKPGPDVFTLYVNPDPRAAEPATGTVKRDLDLGRVDQLVLYSTGAFSMDELRIVDTFAALADYPNPEELKRLAPVAPPPAEILKDDFDERFKLDWQIRNADLSRISLTKKPNTLTITTQDASFYGGSTNHRNLLLTANPIKGDGEFEITTCLIGFDPKVNYQQAGLVCLDDEDNYIKWTYEWNEARGRQVLALIRETAATPAPHTYVYEIPQGGKVWLRLTKQGNRYAYSASSDGQSFRVHGAVAWGDSAPSWLGLLAWNANTGAPEIDASFDFFEVNPQPTITVPPIQPESVLSEERLLDLQLRNLFSQQKLDEAAARLKEAIERYPDSVMFRAREYTLFHSLSRAGRWDDAIPHIQAYIDYLLPHSANSHPSMERLARTAGELANAFGQAGRPDDALKAIDALILQIEQVEGAIPGAAEYLVAQKALFLAAQGKAGEAARIMQQQLEAAKKALEASPEDAGSVLRVAARLQDRVSLELSLKSEAVEARRTEMLAFLTEQAKRHPTQPAIVVQYLQQHYAQAALLSQTDPDRAEQLVDSIDGFLKQDLDEETRRQYARYNLDSIRRRIQSARQLLALIGSQAVWPDDADAWVNGERISAGDRKGKVVLLDFWAVWCGPCIATFPHLRQWREKYGDQGFEIIGVTKYYNCDWDDEAGRIQRVPDLTPEKELDALKRFAAHHDLKHPFAVMAETSLHEHYVVSGIPHVVLIDRGNKVRLIRTGSGEQTALEVEKMIETCLAESKADF